MKNIYGYDNDELSMMLGEEQSRINRGEEYDKEMQKIKESRDLKPTVKCSSKKNLKMTSKGKRFLKRAAACMGSLVLIGNATNIGIAKIKDAKYQKEIDKANVEEFITDIPDEIEISKESREAGIEYLQAVKLYNEYEGKSWEGKEEAERTIIDYTKSGEAKTIAKNVISAKLDQANLYGDYKSSNKDKINVSFINNIEEHGFRISSVEKTFYTLDGFSILNQTIPDNLRNLTEDVLNYKGNWKNREDCLNDGLEIGKDLETVLSEYYILREDGSLDRINEKDFNEKKEEYKEKQEEKDKEIRNSIKENYGITIEPIDFEK